MPWSGPKMKRTRDPNRKLHSPHKLQRKHLISLLKNLLVIPFLSNTPPRTRKHSWHACRGMRVNMWLDSNPTSSANMQKTRRFTKWATACESCLGLRRSHARAANAVVTRSARDRQLALNSDIAHLSLSRTAFKAVRTPPLLEVGPSSSWQLAHINETLLAARLLFQGGLDSLDNEGFRRHGALWNIKGTIADGIYGQPDDFVRNSRSGQKQRTGYPVRRLVQAVGQCFL